MKQIVIYHGGGCADGFCCAWLAHHSFPDAEFVPANYGDPPPDVADAEVIILDFSYPRPVMVGLIGKASRVIVLDHHKTAYDDLAGLSSQFMNVPQHPFIRFDMNKSGARLTWEFLYGKGIPDKFKSYTLNTPPWLVQYTEDRDLWKWQFPDSKEVNAAIRSYRQEFGMWDLLHEIGEKNLQSLRVEGRAVLRADRQIIDSHVKNAREVNFAGHSVLMVNATSHVSEIAGELAKGRPFGVCYFDRQDGKRVWSLRSTTDGLDVGTIAKNHGGGGHKHAAGFEESM